VSARPRRSAGLAPAVCSRPGEAQIYRRGRSSGGAAGAGSVQPAWRGADIAGGDLREARLAPGAVQPAWRGSDIAGGDLQEARAGAGGCSRPGEASSWPPDGPSADVPAPGSPGAIFAGCRGGERQSQDAPPGGQVDPGEQRPWRRPGARRGILVDTVGITRAAGTVMPEHSRRLAPEPSALLIRAMIPRLQGLFDPAREAVLPVEKGRRP
jgi:hypothetical protein